MLRRYLRLPFGAPQPTAIASKLTKVSQEVFLKELSGRSKRKTFPDALFAVDKVLTLKHLSPTQCRILWNTARKHAETKEAYWDRLMGSVLSIAPRNDVWTVSELKLVMEALMAEISSTSTGAASSQGVGQSLPIPSEVDMSWKGFPLSKAPRSFRRFVGPHVGGSPPSALEMSVRCCASKPSGPTVDDATSTLFAGPLKNAFVATKEKSNLATSEWDTFQLKVINFKITFTKPQMDDFLPYVPDLATRDEKEIKDHWTRMAQRAASYIVINWASANTERPPLKPDPNDPSKEVRPSSYHDFAGLRLDKFQLDQLIANNKDKIDRFIGDAYLNPGEWDLKSLTKDNVQLFENAYCKTPLYARNRVLVSDDTKHLLDLREADTAPFHYIPNETLNDKLTAENRWDPDKSHLKAVGVTGPSGSGKTVLIVHASTDKEGFCFYALANDIHDLKTIPKRDSFQENIQLFRNTRREWLCGRIAQSLKNVVTKNSNNPDDWKSFLTVLFQVDKPARMTICIDEGGGYPDVVAAMTQMHSTAFYEFLYKEWKGKDAIAPPIANRLWTFRFVVAGTGIAKGIHSVGSMPGTFDVVEVKDDESNEIFIKYLEYRKTQQKENQRDPKKKETATFVTSPQKMVKLISQHDASRQAIRNRRHAVLTVRYIIADTPRIQSYEAREPMLEHALETETVPTKKKTGIVGRPPKNRSMEKEDPTQRPLSAEPYDGAIPLRVAMGWVQNASIAFVGLNGLSKVQPQHLGTVFSLSLRLYYFFKHHNLHDAIVHYLCKDLGLLVDRSCLVHGKFDPQTKTFTVNSEGNGWYVADPNLWMLDEIPNTKEDFPYRLCIPKAGRYELPPSNIAILSLLLWADAPFLSTASGNELEKGAQYTLALLMIACRREPELEHLIRSPSPTNREFNGNWVFGIEPEGKDPTTPFAPFNLHLWEARKDSFKFAKKDPCYVVLSKYKAPFADVVGVFGKLAVYLQCKDKDEVDATEVLGMSEMFELYKMGLRSGGAVAAFIADEVKLSDTDAAYRGERNVPRQKVFEGLQTHFKDGWEQHCAYAAPLTKEEVQVAIEVTYKEVLETFRETVATFRSSKKKMKLLHAQTNGVVEETKVTAHLVKIDESFCDEMRHYNFSVSVTEMFKKSLKQRKMHMMRAISLTSKQWSDARRISFDKVLKSRLKSRRKDTPKRKNAAGTIKHVEGEEEKSLKKFATLLEVTQRDVLNEYKQTLKETKAHEIRKMASSYPFFQQLSKPEQKAFSLEKAVGMKEMIFVPTDALVEPYLTMHVPMTTPSQELEDHLHLRDCNVKRVLRVFFYRRERGTTNENATPQVSSESSLTEAPKSDVIHFHLNSDMKNLYWMQRPQTREQILRIEQKEMMLAMPRNDTEHADP